MKICSKCKESKLSEDFNKDKSRPDGFFLSCRKCVSKIAKEYREKNIAREKERSAKYYSKNRDSIKEKSKNHYHQNKEAVAKVNLKWAKNNPEKVLLAKNKYYQKNKLLVIAKASEWAKNNPEKQKARSSAFRKKNPEMKRAHARNRRALNSRAEGTHSADDVKNIFTKQRGLCANCRLNLETSGREKYHADHIMPLTLGGSNFPCNLQCLCPGCNLKKSSKDPFSWAEENGRLI